MVYSKSVSIRRECQFQKRTESAIIIFVRPIFIILILLISVACTQDQPPTTTPQINTSLPGSNIVVPSGAYKYFGLDSNNKVVVGGWIRFNPGQINFRGKWHLEAASMWEYGPQNGTGTLQGSAEKNGSSNHVMINLNISRADDNVFLNGTVQGNEFTGEWLYGTLSGEANRGTFYAFKQP